MACKTCDRIESFSLETIESLIDEQLSWEISLASPEIIRERMSICENCPFLQEKTCSKCGCFSRFRASLPMKQCPMGYWLAEEKGTTSMIGGK